MGEIRETEAVHLGREDGVGDGAALGVRGRVAPGPSRRVVLVVDERSPRAVLRAERPAASPSARLFGVGERRARAPRRISREPGAIARVPRGVRPLRRARGIVRVREGPPRRDFARLCEFRFQLWPLDLSSR